MSEDMVAHVNGVGHVPAMSSIENAIRAFISDVFIFESEPTDLPGDISLMKSGVVDSMGILELALHLEEVYGLEIKEAEMIPANLDTIDNIVKFICSKREQSNLA